MNIIHTVHSNVTSFMFNSVLRIIIRINTFVSLDRIIIRINMFVSLVYDNGIEIIMYISNEKAYLLNMKLIDRTLDSSLVTYVRAFQRIIRRIMVCTRKILFSTVGKQQLIYESSSNFSSARGKT